MKLSDDSSTLRVNLDLLDGSGKPRPPGREWQKENLSDDSSTPRASLDLLNGSGKSKRSYLTIVAPCVQAQTSWTGVAKRVYLTVAAKEST